MKKKEKKRLLYYLISTTFKHRIAYNISNPKYFYNYFFFFFFFLDIKTVLSTLNEQSSANSKGHPSPKKTKGKRRK